MNLVYNSDYQSIKKFNTINLPDFALLTGLNGSGKTHLLKGIQNKNINVDGIDPSGIIYFNYENFRLENEGSFNAYQMSSERENAWNLFQNQVKGNLMSLKANLGDNITNITIITETENESIWYLKKNQLQNEELFKSLQQYKNNITLSFKNNGNLNNNQQAKAILSMIKKSKFFFDEVSKEDFFDKYKPVEFKNDFLPLQLGKVIGDYYYNFIYNETRDALNKKYNAKHKVLSEHEFEKVYGEKPWIVLNTILAKFNSIDYRINSPEGMDPRDNYLLKLVDSRRKIDGIDFNSLSSGEKVLMALVASIYKASSDNHFPSLLLLDEIDASLHPSMVQNMLDVIQTIFLEKGTKVILVTHSPTTVALAPEESIYIMNKEGENRIEKKSKEDALEILTEGFITLEKGIKLFDQISKKKMSLITEGRNTHLIEKCFEFYGIQDVEIISGSEDRSGSTQIKTLFDFFSAVPHVKKVLFVWDCDVHYSLAENNTNIPFIFQSNASNDIAKKGIENLFPKELFNDFKITVTMSKGEQKIEFDTTRKKDFESFILERNMKEDFINFEPLVNKVVSLLRT